MKGERLHYIDIAKGIGIIFIVLSHTNPSFVDFISLFHVPVFFIFSGFFFREKYEDQPIIEIKKRIKGLYFPFIRYGILYFKYKDYIKYNYLFGAIALVLLIASSTFQHVGYFAIDISHPFLFLPVASIAAYLIVLVSYKIGENKILEYIGQNTIPVIALHLLCFKAFTAIRVLFFDAPHEELGDYFAPANAQLHLCLIYVVVGVALPLGLHYLWRRVYNKAKALLMTR